MEAEHPFLIWTDHKNLEYIQSAKRLNHRQARWALFFGRFKFVLTFRPGSKKTKPDALSRAFYSAEIDKTTPDTIMPTFCGIGAVAWQVEQEVKAALLSHPSPVGFSLKIVVADYGS